MFSDSKFLRGFVRPKLLPPGKKIVLKDARHPCLEAQDDVQFQPNNINMVHGTFLPRRLAKIHRDLAYLVQLLPENLISRILLLIFI